MTAAREPNAVYLDGLHVGQAIKAAVQRRDAEGITEGTMICPRCGEYSLRYRINPVGRRASSRGQCATKDCLEWMS